jgi:hypothetical protein
VTFPGYNRFDVLLFAIVDHRDCRSDVNKANARNRADCTVQMGEKAKPFHFSFLDVATNVTKTISLTINSCDLVTYVCGTTICCEENDS